MSDESVNKNSKIVKKKLSKKIVSSEAKKSKSTENELLSSVPERLKCMHTFAKEYNVDRVYDEETIGRRVVNSEFNENQKSFEQALDRFNKGR